MEINDRDKNRKNAFEDIDTTYKSGYETDDLFVGYDAFDDEYSDFDYGEYEEYTDDEFDEYGDDAEIAVVLEDGPEVEYEFVPEEDDEEEEISPEDMLETLQVELTTADGEVMTCEVVGLFVVDDDKEYMAMHPLEGPENRVVILPYVGDENGNVAFREFVDDEEYERAIETFNEYFKDDF